MTEEQNRGTFSIKTEEYLRSGRRQESEENSKESGGHNGITLWDMDGRRLHESQHPKSSRFS